MCVFAVRNVEHGANSERILKGAEHSVSVHERHFNTDDDSEAANSSVHYLKYEDMNSCYRPSLSIYKRFPSICFSGDLSSGIFTRAEAKQTGKQSGKKKAVSGGFCKCCDTTYTDLKCHLNSYQHRMFKITDANYKKIDEVINDVEWCSSDEHADSVIADTQTFTSSRDFVNTVSNVPCDKQITLVEYSQTSSASPQDLQDKVQVIGTI